jgi:hypothetical protein
MKMFKYLIFAVISAISAMLILSCASYSPRLGVSNINDADVIVKRLDNLGGYIYVVIEHNSGSKVTGMIGNGQTGIYKAPSGLNKIDALYFGNYDLSSAGPTSSKIEFDLKEGVKYHFSIRFLGNDNGKRTILQQENVVASTSASANNISQRQSQHNDIVSALDKAARDVMTSLQERNLKSLKIAIVNIASQDSEQSTFVAGELEHILVQNRFTIVDRSELDRIRREQNFQLSGEVDDAQVVSIGKFAGAGLVITGSITGSGSMRRLRLRVLDTQTAELKGSASEPF